MIDPEALELFIRRVAADGESRRRATKSPHYQLIAQRECDLGKVSYPRFDGVLMSVAILRDYMIDPATQKRGHMIEVLFFRKMFFWWRQSWRSGVYQFDRDSDLSHMVNSAIGYLETL